MNKKINKVSSPAGFEMFVKTVKDYNYERIYVCSPLSAPTQKGIVVNMLSARAKCHALNERFRNYGIKAWAPHAYIPEMLNDNVPVERQLALDFGIKLLEMSDVIYIFGHKLSSGMKGELRYAITHGMDIIVEDNDNMKLINAVDSFINKEFVDGNCGNS